MPDEKADPVARASVEALRPVYESWSRGDFSPKFEVYAAGLA